MKVQGVGNTIDDIEKSANVDSIGKLLRCAEAYTPAAAWIFPLNGLAITGYIACSTFKTMLIGKVHLVAEQLKEARRADIDTSASIASYTLFSV
jgi:hypothetical protein